MKNISRLTVAAVLVGVLVVVATGVWAAAPIFQGTVPPPPDTGTGGGGGELPPAGGGGVINMGTATFTPDCTDCTVDVTAVDNPAELAPAPEGKAFVGDAFEVTITGTGSVKISFALPPGSDAKIYKLDTSVTPAVWVEVPGAVVNDDGTISVDVTESGTYALIGTP